jgi:antitoxin VapB
MALSIKNGRVEENARELSRILNKPITEAVGEAIEAQLKRARVVAKVRESDDILRKLKEIQDRAAKLPILDLRHPDEILYYENGLPK